METLTMSILSDNWLRKISETYQKRFSLSPKVIDRDGRVCSLESADPIDELSEIVRTRRHALQESLRWGEPYAFFLAPGLISWISPLVKTREILGGLVGGEVIAEDQRQDRLEAINHLVSLGARRERAENYVLNLPAWPQAKSQEAAEGLFRLVYELSGWRPSLLEENRDRALQQRQIAEEIHRRKNTGDRSYSFDEERILLSLIRAGDRHGARRVLNRLLGATFLRSGNVVVVRALMVELLGYLVRRAVEESPYLGSLIEKNQAWTARIIEASGFEDVARAVKLALDDFMQNIYLLGYGSSNRVVRQTLEYIGRHYTGRILLEDVALEVGLSASRLAHLIKEHTGRTILQHVHHLRIREAQRLLKETSLSCADIAYEVGFSDQSYFAKRFRRHTGLTPVSYRRLHL